MSLDMMKPDVMRPELRLVSGPPMPAEPLAKLEAEVMVRCIDFVRAEISLLPHHSRVRRAWDAALDYHESAARLLWPTVRRAATRR
jgi:hypothetical protein